MPGAQCTRSLVCARLGVVSMHTSIHSGCTGNIRHSPRNDFNSLLRALPGDRALLPPSPARRVSVVADLSASVGAPGPYGFAVRKQAALVDRAARVHRIPPDVRDDRDTPLLARRDGESKNTYF